MRRISVLILAVVALCGCSMLGGHDDGKLIWAVPTPASGGDISQAVAIVEDYVSLETGMDVSIAFYDEYSAMVDSLGKWWRPSDMASLPTFAYLVAASQGLAEVGGVAVRYGSTTYRSQIITRSGSGVSTVSDLSGKSFLRPDPFSTSGWIVPEIMMRAAGLNVDAEITVVDADDHAGVVIGVYEGEHDGTAVDAGGTFVDARVSVDPVAYPDVMTMVVVIEESIPIANDGLAFSPAVSDAVRSSVVTAIQKLADSADIAALQTVTSWEDLLAVEDDFYDDVRQLLADAGVNPADYY